MRTVLVSAGGMALLLAMSLGFGQPIAEGSRLTHFTATDKVTTAVVVDVGDPGLELEEPHRLAFGQAIVFWADFRSQQNRREMAASRLRAVSDRVET